jgi:hypothetical protein
VLLESIDTAGWIRSDLYFSSSYFTESNNNTKTLLLRIKLLCKAFYK